jgi:hypothetical protein
MAPSPTGLNRIARMSTWLYFGSTLLYYGFPLGLVAALTPGIANPDWLLSRMTDLPPCTAMTPFKYTAVIGIGWVALLPLVAALGHMRHLFIRYQQGEILTDPCAHHILRTGQWLVALAAVSVLIHPVQTLLMTIDNAPGQKALAVSIDSAILGFLLAGGLLVTIGWVMREAARAAAENASFI